jgi:hypothetical protein
MSSPNHNAPGADWLLIDHTIANYTIGYDEFLLFRPKGTDTAHLAAEVFQQEKETGVLAWIQ